MTAKLVQLDPHTKMTVQEVLELQARNHAELTDVILVGYDTDGELFVRSSRIDRAQALWILMAAIDQIRAGG
jgi:hypothetical protein